MEKIRILFVIDSLKIGGAEVLLLDLARGLADSNYDVFVAYSTPGPLIQEFKSMDIPLYHLPRTSRIDPVLLWRITKLICQTRPHILHTHLFKSDFHGRIAGWMCRVPGVISTLHNQDYWAKNRMLGWLYGTTANFVDCLIAVSDEVRDFHIANTKIPAEKVLTILNGVNVDKFSKTNQLGQEFRSQLSIQSDTPLIGIVGRLLPQKDHLNFLRAAKIVNQSLPGARFLVVGDGELREVLEAEAQNLGIAQEVMFCGIRRDIPAVMAAIDVLVFSSLWEGLPVALLEGMASARPVVATAVGGIPSVLEDRQSGILVPVGNSEKLASACLEILSDPVLASQMGIAGRRRVESKFSIQSMIEKTMDLYNNLLTDALRG